LTFTLPHKRWAEKWIKEFDTATGWPDAEEFFEAEGKISVESRSLAVLREVQGPSEID
jgi:hypothetical protein